MGAASFEPVQRYSVKAATSAMNSAWLSGAQSLFSSYAKGGAFQSTVNDLGRQAEHQINLGYNYLRGRFG